MKLAIRSALEGIRRGSGGPFGACLVRKGRVIAVAHNTVLKTNDPTCHAEINAIRLAAKKLGRHDLKDCVIYSTTEPCPMCFSAIHWARIAHVFWGTAIRDVAARGFNELHVSNARIKRLGKSGVTFTGRVNVRECLELLSEWDHQADKRTY